MADALTRLRPVFGPDWPAFLGQLRADLQAQRAVLARPGEASAARQAAHTLAALAGTAGEAAVAQAALAFLAGNGGVAADLVPGIDRLLVRLDGLAAGAAA